MAINSLSNSSVNGTVLPHIDTHLPAGTIAGTVVGCAAIVIVTALLLYFLVFKKFKKAVNPAPDFDGKPELETNPPENDPNVFKPHEADSEQFFGPELEGKRLPSHEVHGDHLFVSELAASKAVHPELDSMHFHGQELEGDLGVVPELTGSKAVRPELETDSPSQELVGDDLKYGLSAKRGSPRRPLPPLPRLESRGGEQDTSR